MQPALKANYSSVPPQEAPWADEIGQKLFSPPSVSISDSVKLTECAFFHRRTRTLLVTDAVVYVEDKPPESVPEEALLEQGQDGWLAKFLAGAFCCCIDHIVCAGRVQLHVQQRVGGSLAAKGQRNTENENSG